MKTVPFVVFISLVTNILVAQSDSLTRIKAVQQLNEVKLLNAQDSLSYAFGITLNEQLKQSSFNDQIDRITFIKGFIESSDGAASMTFLEATTLLNSSSPNNANKREADAEDEEVEEPIQNDVEQTSTTSNIKLEAHEKKFFSENLQRKEIQTTKNGIQYELILGNGKGTQPKSNDYIKVHYNATYLDGEQIDQTFELYHVNIKYKDALWKEIYTVLRVGSTYKFYLPTSFSSTVPVNYDVKVRKEAIIYTIELIEIGDYEDGDDW